MSTPAAPIPLRLVPVVTKRTLYGDSRVALAQSPPVSHSASSPTSVIVAASVTGYPKPSHITVTIREPGLCPHVVTSMGGLSAGSPSGIAKSVCAEMPQANPSTSAAIRSAVCLVWEALFKAHLQSETVARPFRQRECTYRRGTRRWGGPSCFLSRPRCTCTRHATTTLPKL